MLNGIDISHYDYPDIQFSKRPNIASYDFCIMKASEGIGWKDPKVNNYIERLGVKQASVDKLFYDFDNDKPLIGFYHYARPERGNPPSLEAKNFLDIAADYSGNAIYALDVEGSALSLSNTTLLSWVRDWIAYVQLQTGVKSIVYTGTQGLNKIGAGVLRDDIGLWYARYRNRLLPSMYAPYKFWAFWQYAETPFDKDYFNGTREQYLKYCRIRRR